MGVFEPEHPRPQVQFRTSPQRHQRVRIQAIKENRPMGELIEEALDDYFKKVGA
jgi:predicted HicB family RNase H-like nuclease